MKLQQIWYISNLLSLSRVILLIPIYLLLKLQTAAGNYLAVFIMFIAAATDYFDGHLARKYKQRSDLGRVLDPLSDKICILVTGLILIKIRDLPIWYFLLLVSRDLAILIFGLFLTLKMKMVVESNKIGKVTVAGLAVVLISFTLQLDAVKWLFLWISVGLIAISSINYLLDMVDLLRKRKQFASK